MRLLLSIVLLLLTTAANAGELSPRDAYRLVDDLFSPDAPTRANARDALIASGDASVAAALVEVIFFSEHGRSDAIAALETLLGVRHGRSYHAWIEEIGRRSDVVPKKGYTEFKAKQYARIDPAFAAFLRDDLPRTIRIEEVVFGGVKKDGIPALENPKTIAARKATYLTDDETIFGVSLNGVHRAYPQRILDWHEMVNDVVGGRPISLAYCTLCGAAILFDTRVGERVFTFGSSGLLYRSNKLMYDRQTNSLWSQLEGAPVIGPLVGKTITLPILPLTVTTWGEWKKRHPDSDVLSPETGHRRDYRPGAAYGRYFASPDIMFPVWIESPKKLNRKEWIWSVEIDGVRKAYPLATLVRKPLLHDRVNGIEIVLVTDPSSEAVRVYRSGSRQFTREGDHLVDESGVRYAMTEEALVSGDEMIRLPRVAGHRAYWFGWYAFFPGSELYEE